jgi:hypothetical protein
VARVTDVIDTGRPYRLRSPGQRSGEPALSHMTENQRMQFERPDLRERNTGARVRSTRSLAIFMVIAILIAGALIWATVEALDGWAMYVVLAGIVMTVIGAMIAVSPNRQA